MAAPPTLTQKDFNKWTKDIDRARINIGTVTHIASLTKSFTAAGVAELVSEGKADWVTPVSKYLPEFQLKDPRLTAELTFIDLLSHRTGYPLLDWDWYHRPESALDLIKLMRYIDPINPLRTKWVYDNAMYGVAGEASARIAGTSWEEFIRDKFLVPLGMKSSGFSVKTMLTRPNHALPYGSKSFEAAQRGEIDRLVPDETPYRDAPAGDIFSNVIDLAKWAKVIMHQGKLDGKQVLHKKTVEAITRGWSIITGVPREPEFSINLYGLGWNLEHYKGHRSVQHDGIIVAYRSGITMFPDDDLAVVVLSNVLDNDLAHWLPYYIADHVFGVPKTQDWLFEKAVEAARNSYALKTPAALESFFPLLVKNKPPTRKLEDFVGDFSHPYGHSLSVTVKAGKNGKKPSLVFKFSNYVGTLEHYHYDSFRARLVYPAVTMHHLLTFVTSADGSVRDVRVLSSADTRVYSKKTSLPK
ncbi:hypothetical protein DFQ27_005826 [Actinomortierella ambigua]|uniref:Beta-lactamase-related domain-containing protein n=1 Tax=Actinomortierella ambigua TaxID=1343610 RepID=A0A9P6QKD4_9FUNG|nr:hypothetical protein DFQ27_005826 [Actinomortierella ambigua]